MRAAVKLLTLLSGGIVPMSARIPATQAANLIGYWKLGEPSGTAAVDSSATAADGTYTGTVTVGQPGIGDGSLAASFGGGRVSIATPLATLDGPFDPTLGSLVIWVLPLNAAFWTDGGFHVFAAMGADINNRLLLFKTNTNNTLSFLYTAGGVGANPTAAASLLTWFSMGMTWDKTANQLKAYLNGVQQGATQPITGVWAGALNSSWSAIASQSSGAASSVHSGSLAHCAMWKVALTAAEMATVGIL